MGRHAIEAVVDVHFSESKLNNRQIFAQTLCSSRGDDCTSSFQANRTMDRDRLSETASADILQSTTSHSMIHVHSCL
jgi:hypothetical protein